MYVLHYAPDNASMIIRLVLEEAGLPYKSALVDRANRAQDSTAYRSLNPAGLIPALETPSGPLFETGAILLWLSDRHDLGPNPGSDARGDFLKWLFFLSNTAHADLRQLFYPDQYVPREATAGHHALLSNRMKRHFNLLNQAAIAHPQLFAATPILVAYLAALLRWSALYPKDQSRWLQLPDYPALADLVKAFENRASAVRVAIAEGLGSTPFSNPGHPNPPEGAVM